MERDPHQGAEDADADQDGENPTARGRQPNVNPNQHQHTRSFRFAQFPGTEYVINGPRPNFNVGGFAAAGHWPPVDNDWIPKGDNPMANPDELSSAIQHLGTMDYGQSNPTAETDEKEGKNADLEADHDKIVEEEETAHAEDTTSDRQELPVRDLKLKKKRPEEIIQEYLRANSGIPLAPVSEYSESRSFNPYGVEHLDHHVDIFNQKYTESTHWNPQQETVLSLPYGIVTLIITKISYSRSKYDVFNFLRTCRRLFYGHQSKVYWGKSVNFEETVQSNESYRFDTNPILATNIFRFENNSAFYDIATSIRISSSTDKHQLGLNTRFLTYLPPLIHNCEALRVLKVHSDSLKVIAHLLKVLPPDLQNLLLKFTLANKDQLVDYFSDGDFDLPSLPRCTKLLKFHLDIVHFEWPTSQDSLRLLGTASESLFQRRSAGTLRELLTHIWQNKDLINTKAIKLGRMVYKILDASKDTLLFIKIKRFDLGLIFNPYIGCLPPLMPRVRVFWFDSASNATYTLWLAELLLCLTLQDYKRILGPIIVYYDIHKDKLYSYELQNDPVPSVVRGRAPMSFWREIERSKREAFQQQIELEYDFHSCIH